MSSISNSTLMGEYPNLLFALLTMCVLLVVFNLWMYNQTAPLLAEYKEKHKEGWQGPMMLAGSDSQKPSGFFGGLEPPVTNEYNLDLSNEFTTFGNELKGTMRTDGKTYWTGGYLRHDNGPFKGQFILDADGNKIKDIRKLYIQEKEAYSSNPPSDYQMFMQ